MLRKLRGKLGAKGKRGQIYLIFRVLFYLNKSVHFSALFIRVEELFEYGTKKSGVMVVSNSASIISDVAIDEDTFADFLHAVGGIVSAGKRSRGVLSWDEATLYVSLLTSEKLIGFYDAQDILDWESWLGATPRTMIEIQLGHSKGSIEMYLWLAYEFGKKWNCVVDDVNSVTIKYSETCDRYIRSSVK